MPISPHILVPPPVVVHGARASQQGGYGTGGGSVDPGFSHGSRAQVSSNSYANGASQNTGNVMTGRSSTRVSNPPGTGRQSN